ncbi:zinc metalloproteinase nas-4-like [Anthonomus grandis grandis]|uniref:zinc metalloproteinase nas-4-like n=1 Tax=Anthonomus grandis grandis TaxID=2921223 RepID=UPI002165CE5C|nr:zinc metalloproteinase nas-4-like [Anthonomus grandis grandis]
MTEINVLNVYLISSVVNLLLVCGTPLVGTTVDLSYLGDRIYKTPDPATGDKVDNWNATSDINPEELGEYAEGDIVFTKSKLRNGLTSESSRWPNGEIPYQIDGYFDADSLSKIRRAMDMYHKYTCITFRKREPHDTDYISIVNSKSGCWSSVGRVGGEQKVNLQSPSCITRIGTVVHELMHAAGFLHEQNRAERDDYVSIAWQNIKQGHENNFEKATASSTSGFGVAYDYNSVMHYSSTAFSVNGKPTIIPKDPSKDQKMGQRSGFSRGDLLKINAMYNCPEKTPELPQKPEVPDISDNSLNSNNNNNNNNGPLLGAAQGFLSWLFQKK